MRQTTRELRDGADAATTRTLGYSTHEPVKAVLVGAATGAVLMARLSLVSHSRLRC